MLPEVTISFSEVDSVNDVSAGSFYACMYDKDWFIGVVKYVSKEHNDVMVKFMHPKNLSKHYFWPSRDDECWIPIEDIIKKLSPPSTGSTGRYYIFHQSELQLIVNKL